MRQLSKDLRTAIKGTIHLPSIESERDERQRIEVLEETVTALSGFTNRISRMEEILQRLDGALKGGVSSQESASERCLRLRDEFTERLKAGSFHGILIQQGMLALTVVPDVRPDTRVRIEDIESRFNRELCPLGAGGWNNERGGDCCFTFHPVENEIEAVSEITNQGIIYAAGHKIVAAKHEFLGAAADRDVIYIPSVALERDLIEAVHSYVSFLAELSLPGPWFAAIALINLKKSVMLVGPRTFPEGRIFVGEMILPPTIEVPADADISDYQTIARTLRPAFDYIWREHNYTGSFNYSLNGEWVGH